MRPIFFALEQIPLTLMLRILHEDKRKPLDETTPILATNRTPDDIKDRSSSNQILIGIRPVDRNSLSDG